MALQEIITKEQSKRYEGGKSRPELVMESLEPCVQEQIKRFSRLYLARKAAYKNNSKYSYMPELVRREGVGFLTGLYYADKLNKIECQTLILNYFPVD